jgi:hypothetical protein
VERNSVNLGNNSRASKFHIQKVGIGLAESGDKLLRASFQLTPANEHCLWGLSPRGCKELTIK